MLDAVLKIIESPNFLQGGGIIVGLSGIGGMIYMVQLQVKLVRAFSERVDKMTAGCEVRLEAMTNRSNATIDRNTDTMARHHELLSHLTHALEHRR